MGLEKKPLSPSQELLTYPIVANERQLVKGEISVFWKSVQRLCLTFSSAPLVSGLKPQCWGRSGL